MKLPKNVCENIMNSCLQIGLGRKYMTSIELDPHVGKWRADNLNENEKLIAKYYVYNPSTIMYLYYDGEGLDRLDLKSLIPIDFYDYYGMIKEDCLVKVYRTPPGNFFYPHMDKLNSYVVYHNHTKDKENVSILWTTLTEPKFGHIFLVDDPNKSVHYMLEQGSTVEKFSNHIHVGVNVGWEDRWFMSIQAKRNN